MNTDKEFSDLLESLSTEQLFDIGKNFLSREAIISALFEITKEEQADIINSFQ